MARITVNLDPALLRAVLELEEAESESLDRLVSDLLAEALASRARGTRAEPGLRWESQPMRPLVELSGKGAISDILVG